MKDEKYIIVFIDDDDFDNYDLHSEYETLAFSILSTQRAIDDEAQKIITFCPWAIDGRNSRGYKLYVMTSSGKKEINLLEYQNLGKMLEGGMQ